MYSFSAFLNFYQVAFLAWVGEASSPAASFPVASFQVASFQVASFLAASLE